MKRPRGTGSLFKKPGFRIWWIKYYRGGIPIRESTGKTNKNEASDILKDKVSPTVQALTGPRVERVKVAELATDLIGDYRRKKRKSAPWTGRRWKNQLAPFFGNPEAQCRPQIVRRCVQKNASARIPYLSWFLLLAEKAPDAA